MKHLFLLLLSFFTVNYAVFADEGMWLPLLLKQLNEKDMKKMGMKISSEDIYSLNKSSMKDAVVLFGRGCTAEIISSEGLILTNQHCGISNLVSHSSVTNDLLKTGFWAKTKQQELPNEDLTVTFLIRMEDVTSRIVKDLNKLNNESSREIIVNQRSQEIIKEAIAGTHYEGIVKPMYNGNEYYLFVVEIFKDVRLVGAPPTSIGNFGKDTDNWTWPRHTGDFSLFRIYANKDNKPAEYSLDNVPYTPKYHFSISLDGVKENDFTLLYGYPGRTSEYLTSYAVEQLVNTINPLKVMLRKQRMEIMQKHMNKDRQVYLKYAGKYSQLSNYHKKWAGETKGLQNADAVLKKQSFEKLYENRVSTIPQFERYSGLLDDIGKEYEEIGQIQPEMDLFYEGVLTIELFKNALNFKALADLNSSDYSSEAFQKALKKLKKSAASFFKDYSEPLDLEIAKAILHTYYEKSNRTASPEDFANLRKGVSTSEISSFVDQLFENSFLDNEDQVQLFLENPSQEWFEKLKNDPAYKLAVFYSEFNSLLLQKEYTEINSRLIPLNRAYLKSLMDVVPEKKYYPDANSTLRVAFGKVEGYKPSDAISYRWFTTADGILQKNMTENEEYTIDDRLKSLILAKEYGKYADKDGTLHTCFSASNHTSGGNSGSPVLNAKGQLIGTNFDRNWEGTMSDVYYDLNQVRNITVDIRYTLFIIDKYGGATHLIDELTLVK
jgi:hypothetical protein